MWFYQWLLYARVVEWCSSTRFPDRARRINQASRSTIVEEGYLHHEQALAANRFGYLCAMRHQTRIPGCIRTQDRSTGNLHTDNSRKIEEERFHFGENSVWSELCDEFIVSQRAEIELTQRDK